MDTRALERPGREPQDARMASPWQGARNANCWREVERIPDKGTLRGNVPALRQSSRFCVSRHL